MTCRLRNLVLGMVRKSSCRKEKGTRTILALYGEWTQKGVAISLEVIPIREVHYKVKDRVTDLLLNKEWVQGT